MNIKDVEEVIAIYQRTLTRAKDCERAKRHAKAFHWYGVLYEMRLLMTRYQFPWCDERRRLG